MENEKKFNVDSMVRAADSITGSFKRLKFVTIACLLGTFLSVVFCVAYSISSVTSLNDKIYVLDRGQVMTASRNDVSVTRKDEVVNQATRFHELMFSVSPNRDMVQRNLETALEISDKSAYTYYTDLQEKGFYRRIVSTGSMQDIVVDSVRVDMQQYPYPVLTYASLYMTRESNITKSSLVSRCYMIDTPRNAKNLNGLMIERFEVLESKQVEQRRRN